MRAIQHPAADDAQLRERSNSLELGIGLPPKFLCRNAFGQAFIHFRRPVRRFFKPKWADGMDGVVMASGFQGQQKTHISLERVGLMFKVHRFGTLYFADVHEVSMPCNLLISLTFIGGASRIRTADLWIMIPSL